ncbi:cytochrome c3 family protein [Geothrix edaphica]|uniref:Doubled CXXCH motif domain-containing protein n=1 Tax=Geothrix edaphica TaxID=2927976 RepID=A0ABQ5PZM1_9BACT|nr:cytochrome c3 family protein [Geothrix edaphica]GLH67809.1 hypothetical protein GETHED_21730 [Geothrix edaphica]
MAASRHPASREEVARIRRSAIDAACLACHMNPLPASASKSLAAGPGLGQTLGRAVGLVPAGAGSLGLSRQGEEGLLVPAGGSDHVNQRPGSLAARYTRVVGAGPTRVVLRSGCSACHDPHGRTPKKLRALAFDARGQLLRGVKPASASQVCFGCHAGNEAAPLEQGKADVGLLFSKGAASSHRMGRKASDRMDLPSLRTSPNQDPLDCTSCHANPDPTGLRGPHVSRFPSLLKASYGYERDAGLLGARSNDLCYTCHDQRSIESNRSFPFHREHLLGFTTASSLKAPVKGLRTVREIQAGRPLAPPAGLGVPTPCATCHTAHGSMSQPALIQFDTAVVTRSTVGAVEFSRNGVGHGTCTLTCHGYDHVQTRY